MPYYDALGYRRLPPNSNARQLAPYLHTRQSRVEAAMGCQLSSNFRGQVLM